MKRNDEQELDMYIDSMHNWKDVDVIDEFKKVNHNKKILFFNSVNMCVMSSSVNRRVDTFTRLHSVIVKRKSEYSIVWDHTTLTLSIFTISWNDSYKLSSSTLWWVRKSLNLTFLRSEMSMISVYLLSVMTRRTSLNYSFFRSWLLVNELLSVVKRLIFLQKLQTLKTTTVLLNFREHWIDDDQSQIFSD